MINMSCIWHPDPTLFTEYLRYDPISHIKWKWFPEMSILIGDRFIVTNQSDIIRDIWRWYFTIHTPFGPDMDANRTRLIAL